MSVWLSLSMDVEISIHIRIPYNTLHNMRIFILSLVLTLGGITFATAQSSDESRAEHIDAQIESLKESLDTIDIARLFEQFSLPLGDEARPSEKTLRELENGMDQMLGMMDKIDITAIEADVPQTLP